MKCNLVPYICPKCKKTVVDALPMGTVWCPDCRCWFTEDGTIVSEERMPRKKRG